MVLGAIYHPPKPIYAYDVILYYIENAIAEIANQSPGAVIVLTGDVNLLRYSGVAYKTGLVQVVHQPTPGQNRIDKMYISESDVDLFDKVTMVASIVWSDHKAVVAHGQSLVITRQNTTRTVTFRKVTPAMHAVFLGSPLSAAFAFSQVGTQQEQYDSLYNNELRLLDRFYPERRVTLSGPDSR